MRDHSTRSIGEQTSDKKRLLQIEKGGTAADTALEALDNLNLVSTASANLPNGVAKTVNYKFNIGNMPGSMVGSSGVNIIGPTTLEVNQSAVYTISDFDTFATYTIGALSGTISRVHDKIFYEAPSSGVSCGFIVNGKTYNIPLTQSYTVTRPSITSPINNSSGNPLATTITSSAFNIIGVSDTHERSSWQVATDISFTNIVASSIDSLTNLTQFVTTGLNNLTTYYVRVRHKGVLYGYSDWSLPLTFTTQGAGYVIQPVIISPTNNSTLNITNVTFFSTSFNASNNSDTHELSDWQVATDSGFTSVILNVSSSTVKTSMTDVFTANMNLFVRIRHKGLALGYSQWSDPIGFFIDPNAEGYSVAFFTVGGYTYSEGETITFIVSSTVDDGTTLYWTLDGPEGSSNISAVDFVGGRIGSVVINSGSANKDIVIANDGSPEGLETFVFSLRTDSISGPIVARSIPIYIAANNGGGTPTYSVDFFSNGGTTQISEGQSHDFYIGTTNVPNNTTLYWTLDGSGITAQDFVGGSSGQINISGGSAQVTVTAASDGTAEPNETFALNLRTGSISGPIVATSQNVVIAASGSGGGSPTYTVSPVLFTTGGGGSIYEGESIDFNITTTGVPNNTGLFWTIEGTNITGADFVGGISGSMTIVNGQATVSKTAALDGNIESTESFIFKVRTDSVSGPVVAASYSINIINAGTGGGSNTAPSFTFSNGVANNDYYVTYNTGLDNVAITPNIIIADTELDLGNNWNGAKAYVKYTTALFDVVFNSTGNVSVNLQTISGTQYLIAYISGSAVAEISVIVDPIDGTKSRLILTFGTTATRAVGLTTVLRTHVEQVLRALMIELKAAPTVSQYSVDLFLLDGNTGVQGTGGELEASSALKIYMPNNTYLSEFCTGADLNQVYANGSGGTTTNVTNNSPSCGAQSWAVAADNDATGYYLGNDYVLKLDNTGAVVNTFGSSGYLSNLDNITQIVSDSSSSSLFVLHYLNQRLKKYNRVSGIIDSNWNTTVPSTNYPGATMIRFEPKTSTSLCFLTGTGPFIQKKNTTTGEDTSETLLVNPTATYSLNVFKTNNTNLSPLYIGGKYSTPAEHSNADIGFVYFYNPSNLGYLETFSVVGTVGSGTEVMDVSDIPGSTDVIILVSMGGDTFRIYRYNYSSNTNIQLNGSNYIEITSPSSFPNGARNVKVDTDGNIYIAGYLGHVIKMLSTGVNDSNFGIGGIAIGVISPPSRFSSNVEGCLMLDSGQNPVLAIALDGSNKLIRFNKTNGAPLPF